MTLLELYVEVACERTALREQLALVEGLWLAAEKAADHWYFEANNPAEARAEREAWMRSAQRGEPITLDTMADRAATLRTEIDHSWAASVAGKKAS